MSSLLEATEELIRVCLRRSLLDREFRVMLEDTNRLAEEFPVKPPLYARCRKCRETAPNAPVLRCDACERTWPDEARFGEMETELRQLKKERHFWRKSTDAATEAETQAPNASDTPQDQAVVAADADARTDPERNI